MDFKYIPRRVVPFLPPPAPPISYVQSRIDSAQRYAAERVDELKQAAEQNGCGPYATINSRELANPVQLTGVKTAQLFADRWATVIRYLRHTLETWQQLNTIVLDDEDAYVRLWTDLLNFRPRVVTLGRSLYRFINRYANDYIVRDELVFAKRLEEKDPSGTLTRTFPLRNAYLAGINEWLDRVKAVSAAVNIGTPASEALLDFYLPWDARVWAVYFNPPSPSVQEQQAVANYRQGLYENATNEDIDRTNEWLRSLQRPPPVYLGPLPPSPFNLERRLAEVEAKIRAQYPMANLPIIPSSPIRPPPIVQDIKGEEGNEIRDRGWIIQNDAISTPTEFWSAIGFSPFPATRAKQIGNVCRGVFATKDISQYIQKYQKAYPRTTLRAISIHKRGEEKEVPIAFALLASRWMAGNINYFVPAKGEDKWIERRVVDEKNQPNRALTTAINQSSTTNVWELAYLCADSSQKGAGSMLLKWIIDNFGQDPATIPLVLEVAESDTRAKLIEYYRNFGFEIVQIQYLREGRPFQAWHTQIAGKKVVPLLMVYHQ